jgi:hypothetical protein
MLSLSVITILLFSEDENPIRAKFFKYSQPNAPAPTIKIFDLEIISWILFPKIAI